MLNDDDDDENFEKKIFEAIKTLYRFFFFNILLNTDLLPEEKLKKINKNH